MKRKQDIKDIIEKKRLQFYGHIKGMPEDRIPKLIMQWTPTQRKKRRRPRKSGLQEYKQPWKQGTWNQINGEREMNGFWFVEDGDSCYETGQTDRQIDRQIDRQMIDRQIDRQMIDRQIDR